MLAPLSKASAAIASLAAIAAAGAIVFATPSLAAWSNPMPISSSFACASAIGMDADGKAIIAYTESGGRLFVKTRLPDGQISNRKRITDQPTTPPVLAVNAGGTAAVVWKEFTVNAGLHLRLLRSDGALTPDQIIWPMGDEPFNIEVGIDQAGNALVSWSVDDGVGVRTFLRRRNASTGALGAIQSVSPTTGIHNNPHLAMEPGGRAFVTYTTIDGIDAQVFGRARGVDGTLSDAAAMSTLSQGGGIYYAVALDGSGTALVAWEKLIDGVLRVQARTRAVSGARSPIATLSGAAVQPLSVRVAIGNTGGIGVVSWLRERGADIRVESSRLFGGEWQAVEPVSPAGMGVLDHALGVSGNGNRAIFLFRTSENPATAQRLRARMRRPDGSFSAADIVSVETGLAPRSPTLSVNADGKAAATWRQQDEDEQNDLCWVGTNFLQ